MRHRCLQRRDEKCFHNGRVELRSGSPSDVLDCVVEFRLLCIIVGDRVEVFGDS